MAFTKSTPPASASKSIFNVFSPSTSASNAAASSAASSSTSRAASAIPSVSSWFSDEVKKSESESGASEVGSSSSSSDETASSSFLGYFIRFILVALLLGFAGFNVFKEMGLITDDVVEFVRPVTDALGGLMGAVGKQFVSATSEGTRTGIDIVSGAAKSGVNVIDSQVTGNGLPTASQSDDPSVVPSSGGGTAKQEAARARALTMKTGAQLDAGFGGPLPDEATSVTQKGTTSGKAGYCLVGEDRGNRSCIYVNESDTCMSGNIFPSKDKCINPSLRV
jgi:hypothetical protein